MNRYQIKSQGCKSLRFYDLTRALPGISVQFHSDSPCFLPIKIQPQKLMNNPDAQPEKPLIPALFQIAARADELQTLQSVPQSEMPWPWSGRLAPKSCWTPKSWMPF